MCVSAPFLFRFLLPGTAFRLFRRARLRPGADGPALEGRIVGAVRESKKNPNPSPNGNGFGSCGPEDRKESAAGAYAHRARINFRSQ